MNADIQSLAIEPALAIPQLPVFSYDYSDVMIQELFRCCVDSRLNIRIEAILRREYINFH